MRPLDERPAAGLSRAAFEAEVLPRFEPMVLRGLVAHWPGVQMAAQGDAAVADWLRAHASPDDVDAVMLPPDQGRCIGYRDGVGPGFNFLRNRLPLGDLINQIQRYTAFRHAPAVAAQSALLSQCAPGLVATHGLPLVDAAIALPRLWLGNAITTPAHVDESHNVACVVAGERRFLLYPPDAIAHLQVGPLGQGPAGTPVSLSDPQVLDTPAQAKAHALARDARLGPGDAIYIPPLWWHRVDSERPLNLLINFWWQRSQAAAGLDALLHTLLALHDRSPAERAAWRTVFEHWVFSATPQRFTHLPPGLQGLHAGVSAEQAAAVREQLRTKLSP